MLSAVGLGLKRHFDPTVVDELLAAYEEAKRNFYLGGLRLSAVEGGRFCEAAFRLLEQAAAGQFTPLNHSIKSEQIIASMASTPKGALPESLRTHIPRALRVVYDIRNKRDAAHLADGIDPNQQDAIFVASVLDWVLAEFVRLFHSTSADEAEVLIDELVTRRAPAVEDFDGFVKVLKPKLLAGDYILLILYERGKNGATLAELSAWIQPKMRKNLARTLNRLVEDQAFLHYDGNRYLITRLGIQSVERRKLHGNCMRLEHRLP